MVTLFLLFSSLSDVTLLSLAMLLLLALHCSDGDVDGVVCKCTTAVVWIAEAFPHASVRFGFNLFDVAASCPNRLCSTYVDPSPCILPLYCHRALQQHCQHAIDHTARVSG